VTERKERDDESAVTFTLPEQQPFRLVTNPPGLTYMYMYSSMYIYREIYSSIMYI